MTGGQWAVVVILALLIAPIGLMGGMTARTRARHAASATSTPSQMHPATTGFVGRTTPGRHQCPTDLGDTNPPGPDRFEHLTEGHFHTRDGWIAASGVKVYPVRPEDSAAYLIGLDPATSTWFISPNTPAWGGWGDWMVDLSKDLAAATTDPAHRVLEAFLSYGAAARAHQNGAP